MLWACYCWLRIRYRRRKYKWKGWDFTAVIHQHWLESLRCSWSSHSLQTRGEIWSAPQIMFLLIPDWTADCFLCAYKWKMSLLTALISRIPATVCLCGSGSASSDEAELFLKSADHCIRLIFKAVWKICASGLKEKWGGGGGLWRWVRGELFPYGLRSLNQQCEAGTWWSAGLNYETLGADRSSGIFHNHLQLAHEVLLLS